MIVSDAVESGLNQVGPADGLIDEELALRIGLDAFDGLHAGLSELVKRHRGAGLGLPVVLLVTMPSTAPKAGKAREENQP